MERCLFIGIRADPSIINYEKDKITFKIDHVKEGKQNFQKHFKNAKSGTHFHKDKTKYNKKTKTTISS